MDKLTPLITYLKSEYITPPRNFDLLDAFSCFRAFVNVRQAESIDPKFLTLQDEVLQEITQQKGLTSLHDLTEVRENIFLWQGDITTLQVDAIVNAANSGMTGCYVPCHGCIDNAIHTFAGVQLRLECQQLMKQQGHSEPTGTAKITAAYNLPCKHVIHTVGPIISSAVTAEDCRLLASSYLSCLELAQQHGLDSIAFCCISTGEFRFPNEQAARIAIDTVSQFISKNTNMKVIFNVFKDLDYNIYRNLLS